MKLAPDWKWLLRRAWSVRLLVVAALLTGLEVAIQVVLALGISVPIPPGIFALLSGLVSTAALIARFVAQSRDD